MELTDLEKLKSWILTFPNWDGKTVVADCIPNQPNLLSIVPQGLRVIGHKQDLLGNCRQRLQSDYTLYYTGLGSAHAWEDADTMAAFQLWAQAQNAQGRCPHFGDTPNEQLSARQGKLLRLDKLGLSIYTVQITVTYEKNYEVNENGKN